MRSAGGHGSGPRRGGGPKQGWRPSILTIGVGVILLAAMVAGLYPMTAAWLSSYNQSQAIREYGEAVSRVRPTAAEQLATAHAYNDAMSAGVLLGANANMPVGEGVMTDDSFRYDDILRATDDGIMARIKIPRIGVDLPIYHGTSDEVLLLGAGHLEGSSLPVGGVDTHSVITAHRGLANATMFSNLDGVELGDRFTVEVFGEVLTYEVRAKEVIEPAETDSLRAEPGHDWVTLITCTPLGINSHRIVLTGERVTPTPSEDSKRAGDAPTIPGVPWWALYATGGLTVIATYVSRQGFADAKLHANRGNR
ncbi:MULTISPECIES: class C sortase [unclassified Leucobacter]|uniref:class C sortase n=1 Tax=unclassified Leucobacter TaxID=2621730 RepID=UPI001BFE4211|nr:MULTISPECIES: class C sortase [unclassified Leucobacter]